MLTKSLAVLALIGLVDSISYMAVSPSLIFYVVQLGGSKEQYGLIISTFSLASFAAKPIYGSFVDRAAQSKFRLIYLISFVLSISGALIYFVAGSLDSVLMIFIGRFLGGLGAANQALGYAYLALAVPQELQTRTTAMLSMMRIVGMATGPAVNAFLGKIDATIFGVAIDSLNVVGLLLAALNLLAVTMVYFFLSEPPKKDTPKGKAFSVTAAPPQSPSPLLYNYNVVLSIEILLPIFIIFVAVASFQLIETALPPATSHSLGWGPVEASTVLGGSSVVIFGAMVLVMILSSKKVSDTVLVVIGNLLWVVGGAAIYLLWTDESLVWHFIVPVMISMSGFPFLGSPNRSNFTKSVKSKPELENSQAMMQAILSMASDVAGFLTPSFVAAFVIRTPEEVEAAGDHRELTYLALYGPIFCILSLLCLAYKYRREQRRAEENQKQLAGEGTPLVASSTRARRRSSVVEVQQEFSRKNEVARRSSTEMMGLCAFDTREEKENRDKMLLDLQVLESLGELDFEEEGCLCFDE
mmetsp:Transcript_11351/g.17402  ORF Transcript_11351/g.17402 Transcript_11351/m.17402 type:complete len:526 (+) Transcript_11351:163-1740(+)